MNKVESISGEYFEFEIKQEDIKEEFIEFNDINVDRSEVFESCIEYQIKVEETYNQFGLEPSETIQIQKASSVKIVSRKTRSYGKVMKPCSMKKEVRRSMRIMKKNQVLGIKNKKETQTHICTFTGQCKK